MASRKPAKTSAKSAPTQQTQGRRPTARSERTRLEVLNAAAACIAEEGFAAASTIRIAERANVSWGVLQYHFGDKSGLMAALLDYGMQETERGFNSLINEGIDAETLEQRLHILVSEGWKIYSTPLARAATEIVINNRGALRTDPQLDKKLLKMNQTQLKLAGKVMLLAVKDKKIASKLVGIYLAAMHGFEARLLQYNKEHQFTKDRNMLVQLLAAYVRQQ